MHDKNIPFPNGQFDIEKWKHSAWVFSCKFAVFFQNTFS